MTLRSNEVFVPGAYPKHTYIERADQGLEDSLTDALSTTGTVVSLAGPSKSGKTVLVEKVVGKDNLIPISGTSIDHPDDVWNRVLDWMDVPNSITESKTTSGSLGVEIGATAEIARESSAEKVRERRGLLQAVHEIGNSSFVILIDDFHYMRREVQTEVAKSLKEAVRQDVKIVTAMVRHRGDDVVRANPELRGRVRAIDLQYWKVSELEQIAVTGFKALNAELPDRIKEIVLESAGSPQLMQLLCLQTCFVLNLREKKFLQQRTGITDETLKKILEQTSSSTEFRSLVDVLDAGPRTRGTERKTYKFEDGTTGDVYRAVLKALADNPPRLSFPYDRLLERVSKVCKGDSPVGSSVSGTCLHMAKLAEDKFPNERALDWDEQKQVFDIPDPYLLFYLRWSDRLQEE